MGHHVDGVDAFFRTTGGHHLHHLFRHLIGAGGPDIDNLVVLLAAGDQTILILLLEFLDLILSRFQQTFLGCRNDHIVLTEGDTGTAGVIEAERHHAVTEDNGFFLTTVTIDSVNDVGDLFLGQQTVDQRERHLEVAWQQIGKDHPARGGNHLLQDFVTIFVTGTIAGLDPGIDRDITGMQGMLDLADTAEVRHCIGVDVLLGQFGFRVFDLVLNDPWLITGGIDHHHVAVFVSGGEAGDIVNALDLVTENVVAFPGHIVEAQNDIL